MKKHKKKVVVAMSGGVDSSAVALMMKQTGHEVIGLYMRLGQGNEQSEQAARKVCQALDIKFYPVNLAGKFRKEIIDYFLSSYENGQTPNPCVKCNRLIKFGELLRIKKELGADYLATGHYVRRRRKFTIYDLRSTIYLLRGVDQTKDQSYFLYSLSQNQLRSVRFPLGNLRKDDVRILVEKAELPYLKTESQDVCFLNQNGKIMAHNDYLKNYIKLEKGEIKTLDGRTVGEHQGLPLYTIGQRRGVEIGGTGPYYVVKTDYQTNTLYVTNDPEDPELFSQEFTIKNVNWISDQEPKFPLESTVVIRYRHQAVQCTIKKDGDKYFVQLKNPERAITPGQSAVFYDNEQVVGGGIIV